MTSETGEFSEPNADFAHRIIVSDRMHPDTKPYHWNGVAVPGKHVIDEIGEEWFIGESRVAAITTLMQGNQEDGRVA